MRSMWWMGVLMLAACGDDELPSDRALDGGAPDSSVDGSTSPVSHDSSLPPTCDPLPTTIKFYMEGGLSPLRDVYSVSPDGSVKLERLPGGAYMDAGTLTCAGSLGQCNGPVLDLRGIGVTLELADERWGDGSQVLGGDPRPFDGQVLVVERTSDGKKIVVGTKQCEASTPCGAFPDDAERLERVFNRIRTELALGDKGDGGLAGSCTR